MNTNLDTRIPYFSLSGNWLNYSDGADAAAEGEHAVPAGCVADAFPAAQSTSSSG